jgi:hypothetical protein
MPIFRGLAAPRGERWRPAGCYVGERATDRLGAPRRDDYLEATGDEIYVINAIAAPFIARVRCGWSAMLFTSAE